MLMTSQREYSFFRLEQLLHNRTRGVRERVPKSLALLASVRRSRADWIVVCIVKLLARQRAFVNGTV